MVTAVVGDWPLRPQLHPNLQLRSNHGKSDPRVSLASAYTPLASPQPSASADHLIHKTIAGFWSSTYTILAATQPSTTADLMALVASTAFQHSASADLVDLLAPGASLRPADGQKLVSTAPTAS